MQKYFFEVRNFIEAQYPDFRGNIIGANYPPPIHAQYVAQLTSIIWMVGIAFLLAGSQILGLLGFSEPYPALFELMNKNKVGVFFALFILNNVGNSMLTTGSLFSVYVYVFMLAFSNIYVSMYSKYCT